LSTGDLFFASGGQGLFLKKPPLDREASQKLFINWFAKIKMNFGKKALTKSESSGKFSFYDIKFRLLSKEYKINFEKG